MTKRKQQALALFITLLLMSVLSIMAVSLVLLTRQQALGAIEAQRQCLAHQAAEAGLAHAVHMLGADPAWNGSAQPHTLSDGQASYRLCFGPGPLDSIKNLEGSTPLPGAYGVVPPGGVWLTAVGRCGTTTRILDAILARPSLPLLEVALLATGRIEMHGNVHVEGRETAVSERVPAGLHSNFRSPGNPSLPSISWTPLQGSDQAVVHGPVTSSDPRDVSETIRFQGTHQVDETLSSQPTRQMARYDIQRMVAGARDEGQPVTLTGAETWLDGGKHFVSAAEVRYAGDIILENGAELYIDGNLDLEGSIRGSGSVVVNGATHLRGDVDINPKAHVALLSRGDVHIEGYDAKSYLDSVSAAQPLLGHIQDTLHEMHALLQTGHTSHLSNYGTLDKLNHHLNDAGAQGHAVAVPGRPAALLRDLRGVLESQPADAQGRRNFLLRKLGKMEVWHNHNGDKMAHLLNFVARPSLNSERALEGLCDVGAQAVAEGRITHSQLRNAMLLAANICRNNQLEKLSSSYFQGLVYTDGSFRASKEVVLTGALLANRDIVLEQGTTVTFLKELFEGEEALKLPGKLEVVTWSVR